MKTIGTHAWDSGVSRPAEDGDVHDVAGLEHSMISTPTGSWEPKAAVAQPVILVGEIGHCVPTNLHQHAEAFGTDGHHEVLMCVCQSY